MTIAASAGSEVRCMATQQREQNPDVNSYNPDGDPAEDRDTGREPTPNDVERAPNDGGIPVPPDSGPTAPVEEPPDADGVPLGDVDDSPKRIM